MLVLSRHRNESIMIGDDIELVVADIRGDKVRIGITAPKEVPVHRREIYDQIKGRLLREAAEKEASENKSENKESENKDVENEPS